MPGTLDMWTVYDHPSDSDMPYVARLWHVDASGAASTDTTFAAGTIELVRSWLMMQGFFRVERHPDDDPAIMETWL